MVHLKSHLKNCVDLEVFPLLVLETALKDALIYFQLQRTAMTGISREEKDGEEEEEEEVQR